MQFRPNFDRLESITPPATVFLSGGWLLIVGDVGTSNIQVDEFGPDEIVVFADDQDYRFATADVQQIAFVSSDEGGDQFINDTGLITFARVTGRDNVLVGVNRNLVIDDAIGTIYE